MNDKGKLCNLKEISSFAEKFLGKNKKNSIGKSFVTRRRKIESQNVIMLK